MQVMDILTLVAGLGLFLYGIKEMGEGLEKAAGRRMQHLLEVLTRNKLTAVFGRRISNRRDSKFKRDHCNGRGLCERRFIAAY